MTCILEIIRFENVFVHSVKPSRMQHRHPNRPVFGYMDTGGVVYTVPRTWHPHTFDGNPPKRPTSHLIVDILGLAADDLGSSEDDSSGKPDSRPESADSVDTAYVPIRRRIAGGGIPDRDPGVSGKATSGSGGNRSVTWSGSVADHLMWTTRGVVDVRNTSRSAEWSRSRDDQSLEGQ